MGWACGSPEKPRPPDDTKVPNESVPTDPWINVLPPPDPVDPGPPIFQVAYSQALRWSQTSYGTATFRLKIPLGRAGTQVRLSFRSGNSSLSVSKVRIA